MHHFFVDKQSINAGSVTLDAQQSRQIRKVLRMNPGDKILVLDNTGWQYLARLESVEKDTPATALVLERRKAKLPDITITLYQGFLKRDKFELILQKCTETGVSAFCPVVTKTSIVRDTRIKAAKAKRWQKILQEAAEQSRRPTIPQLLEPLTLEAAAERLSQHELVIVPWENAADSSIKEVLNECRCHKQNDLAIFIGPEGGIENHEMTILKDAGAREVSLGPNILRTETAAIVTSALLIYELSWDKNKR